MFVSARIGGKPSRDGDVFAAAGPFSIVNSWNTFVRLDGGLDWGQVEGGGLQQTKARLTSAKNHASAANGPEDLYLENWGLGGSRNKRCNINNSCKNSNSKVFSSVTYLVF